MFGIGRSKQRRGVFSARTGLMSVAALGLAYAGRKLWQRKKGEAGGLREAYSESSEWAPDTQSSQSAPSPQSTPSYG